MAYRLFVSHGSEDSYIVERLLLPDLKPTEATLFFDKGAIAYGDDFRAKILAELALADELLVLLTPTSIQRPWIFAEIGAMLQRDRRVVGVRYGTTEAELQKLGILSLLGTTLLLTLNEFEDYVAQVRERVESHRHE